MFVNPRLFLILIPFYVFIQCNLVNSNGIIGFPVSMERNGEMNFFVKSIFKNYTACKQSIQNLVKFNILDPFFRPFIEFSGKRLNDFGNFDECQKSKNVTYFLIMINAPNFTSPLYIGSCLPDFCTNETLYLVINSYLAYLFPFVSQSKDLVFITKNVKEYNLIVNSTSYGFYITIILLILYLGIVLFATIQEYYTKWIKKNKDTEVENFYNLHTIIGCFSLKSNIELILKTDKKINSGLNVFHFLRCIGMFWVVSAHIFLYIFLGINLNHSASFHQYMHDTFTVFLRNATLSVDMFFTISGFFSTLSFINIFEKSSNRTIKSLLLFYCYRYIRLFPMMFLAWIIAVFLLPNIVHGVDTSLIYNNSQLCYSRFFPTFLYIDNLLVSLKQFCNNYIWYLYIEMQLFVISPFIIYPIFKNVTLGLYILLGCSLISLGFQTYYFQTYHYSGAVSAINGPFNPNYYQNTIMRCNTYFIGILFCYLFLESKGKRYLKSTFLHICNKFFTFSIFRYCIVLFGTFLMIFVLFSQNYFDHTLNIPQYLSTLYLLFGKILFVIGMMLLVYPSLLGYGRVVHTIFGNQGFNIIAKITYGTYMLHIPLITYFLSLEKNTSFNEFYQTFILCIQIYFLAYLISFFCSAIFESPFVQLLKPLTQYLTKSK